MRAKKNITNIGNSAAVLKDQIYVYRQVKKIKMAGVDGQC